LISQQHWEKVSGYIRLGLEEGATLLAGGPDKPAGLSHGNFLRPTVLADVDNRMRIAQEEIFGPVACLLPFKSEEDGLRMANDDGVRPGVVHLDAGCEQGAASGPQY
jgi:5-carboxymethyl-2-hydroxymuconic-semialdehyde dehydrogenase